MTTRRFPIPWSFALAISMVIFLMIFFGAWAVSADAGGNGRSLSFGFASEPKGTGTQASALDGAAIPSDDGGGKWWESALIKACPFH